jgi:hypothetical protein
VFPLRFGAVQIGKLGLALALAEMLVERRESPDTVPGRPMATRARRMKLITHYAPILTMAGANRRLDTMGRQPRAW